MKTAARVYFLWKKWSKKETENEIFFHQKYVWNNLKTNSVLACIFKIWIVHDKWKGKLAMKCLVTVKLVFLNHEKWLKMVNQHLNNEITEKHWATDKLIIITGNKELVLLCPYVRIWWFLSIGPFLISAVWYLQRLSYLVKE